MKSRQRTYMATERAGMYVQGLCMQGLHVHAVRMPAWPPRGLT